MPCRSVTGWSSLCTPGPPWRPSSPGTSFQWFGFTRSSGGFTTPTVTTRTMRDSLYHRHHQSQTLMHQEKNWENWVTLRVINKVHKTVQNNRLTYLLASLKLESQNNPSKWDFFPNSKETQNFCKSSRILRKMLQIWGKESNIAKKPRFYEYKADIHQLCIDWIEAFTYCFQPLFEKT